MIANRQSTLVRWFFIACLCLFSLQFILDLVEHPRVATTAGTSGVIYLILFIVALLIYGCVVFFRVRTSTPEERTTLQQGVLWGLLCGIVWGVELFVANRVSPQIGQFYLVLYYGSVLIGYLLPGLAGLITAWRTGRIVSGIQAGLFCGMSGGVMIFLASLLLSALNHTRPDAQTIREFERSGLPDITTYIVGDYLAAMIAHLWIGLITGFFLGIFGGMVGKAFAVLKESTPEVTGHFTSKQERSAEESRLKAVSLLQGRKIISILLWIVTILLVVLFLVEGTGKLFLDPGTVKEFLKWGYPVWLVVVVGILESAGALLLLFPRFTLSGSLLLIADMIGAIVTGIIQGSVPIILFSVVVLVLIAFIGWTRRKRFVWWHQLEAYFHR